MQRNSNSTDIKSIIRKYADGRWISGGKCCDYKFELAFFLVEKKLGEKARNIISTIKQSSRYAFEYQSGILMPEEESILSDFFRDAIEMICTPERIENNYGEENIQPKEITEFVAKFLNPKDDNGKYYNPFFGLGSYALALPKLKFKGEELYPPIWALAMIRLLANGIANDSIMLANSLDIESNGKYDGIISTPPFSTFGDLATEKLIDRFYEQLNENGTLVMVIPAGFLFSSNKSAQDVRLKLILNKSISNVTLFPSGVYMSTNIATAMIVITRTPNEKVTFTDASNAFIKKAGVSRPRIFCEEMLCHQIDSQSDDDPISIEVPSDKVIGMMTINPLRYLLPSTPLVCQTLECVCEIPGLTQFPDGLRDTPYFSPANLTPEFARSPIKIDKLTVKDIKPGRYYYVDFPAILFDYNPQTDVTRVAYTGPNISNGFVVSQYVYVLDLRGSKCSEKLIMLMLSNKRVKRQFKEKMFGAVTPRIKPSDLASIEIPVMTNEEQDKVIIAAMDASMSDAEREKNDAFERYRKDVRIRKHALSQTISSISALWNALEKYREANKSISGSDIIGKANPISVDTICNKISGLLTTIIGQTDKIADIEYNWGEPSWTDLHISIPQIAKKYENTSFHVVLGGSYDPNSFDRFVEYMKDHKDRDVLKFYEEEEKYDKHLKECVEFPTKALERIIVNIVSNAIEYGFTDESRKDYKIFFDWFEEDGNLVLTISNNGTPLSEDASEELVLSYGFSTKLNESGHAGIGGHEIASIMEQYGGRAEFISTPDEEFTVTYKLTFTRCSEYLPEDEED